MRKGKFTIPRELVEKASWDVTRIMSQCIIVRCEMIYLCDGFEYEAISRHFDDVPLGQITPDYSWVVNENGSIKAEKQTFK